MKSRAAASVLLALSALFPGYGREGTVGRKYYYEDIFQPFFAVDPARPDYYRPQRFGADASSFPARKDKEAFRVFIIGGSVAKIYQEDLREPLQSALPSRKVEVINCGVTGYDSFRAALVEEEILKYSPDLILLVPGHNENPQSRPLPPWRLRLSDFLASRAVLRALAEHLRPDPPAGPEAVRRTEAAFAGNLRRIVRGAAARGTKTVLVAPPLNYRDAPPERPIPGNADFARGWLGLLRRDYREAENGFERALNGPRPVSAQDRPLALFLLGRSQEALGELARSRRSFEAAMEAEGLLTGGCHAACRQTIRGVAAREGAIFLDLDQLFRGKAFPRLPGLDMFSDRVHWRRQCNGLVSLGLMDALRQDPTLGALPWKDSRLRDLHKESDAAPGRRTDVSGAQTLRYALRYFYDPRTARSPSLSMTTLAQLDNSYARHPGWFRDLATLAGHADRNPDKDGPALDPGRFRAPLPRLYWHLGVVLMLHGDYRGACEKLAMALRLEPSNPHIPWYLGIARGLSSMSAPPPARGRPSL